MANDEVLDFSFTEFSNDLLMMTPEQRKQKDAADAKFADELKPKLQLPYQFPPVMVQTVKDMPTPISDSQTEALGRAQELAVVKIDKAVEKLTAQLAAVEIRDKLAAADIASEENAENTKSESRVLAAQIDAAVKSKQSKPGVESGKPDSLDGVKKTVKEVAKYQRAAKNVGDEIRCREAVKQLTKDMDLEGMNVWADVAKTKFGKVEQGDLVQHENGTVYMVMRQSKPSKNTKDRRAKITVREFVMKERKQALAEGGAVDEDGDEVDVEASANIKSVPILNKYLTKFTPSNAYEQQQKSSGKKSSGKKSSGEPQQKAAALLAVMLKM